MSVRPIIAAISGIAGAQLIGLIFVPLLTQLYSPETFGHVGFILAISAILLPISTLSFPVAIVLAGNSPYARIYVPEPYRVKIATGNKLFIHVDGVAETITGKVRWISTEPAFTPYYALNQEERSRLMYLAEVQLPDDYANLPNGVAVQVELP